MTVLGPEATRLWERVEASGTKNLKADWGDGSYEVVEQRARQINEAWDQIESGASQPLTKEQLKGI